MHSDNTNKPAFRAAELGALLARHYPDAPPHLVAAAVHSMQAAARKAVAWETRRCNCPMTDAQDEAGRKRLDNAQARINAVLARAILLQAPLHPEECDKHVSPATIELGGDPRGPCARLHIPGQRGDGWGEGFAVF